MIDALAFDPPPAEWRPLSVATRGAGSLGEVRHVLAAGKARLKVCVLRGVDARDDLTVFGPEERRELLEANGAPNGLQIEYPLDADGAEELSLEGIEGWLWHLEGGSYVRRPPAAGWGRGGEHAWGAVLTVPEESWAFLLGGAPADVATAAPALRRWLLSARRTGPAPTRRRARHR